MLPEVLDAEGDGVTAAVTVDTTAGALEAVVEVVEVVEDDEDDEDVIVDVGEDEDVLEEALVPSVRLK